MVAGTDSDRRLHVAPRSAARRALKARSIYAEHQYLACRPLSLLGRASRVTALARLSFPSNVVAFYGIAAHRVRCLEPVCVAHSRTMDQCSFFLLVTLKGPPFCFLTSLHLLRSLIFPQCVFNAWPIDVK